MTERLRTPSGSRRRMRRSVVSAAVTALLTCVLAPAAGAATPDQPLKKGDFAGSFGIGHGRSMYLECFGTGTPTVILDAGLRNGAAIWGDAQRTDESPPGPTVLPGIARFTRVCAYDRPATLLTTTPPITFSRSSTVAMPRTATGTVADLHTLLGVAKVPGPYVFVNHSTGGLIDRLYAAEYPRQVAGMVLVDALAEYFRERLTTTQFSAWGDLNNAPIPELGYPLETFRWGASFAQTRAAARRHPLGDIPLSVISHGRPFELPADLPGGLTSQVIERAWTHAQDKLARLTSHAVHVIARRSSHYIQLSEPELVIAQTRRVVDLVRRDGR